MVQSRETNSNTPPPITLVSVRRLDLLPGTCGKEFGVINGLSVRLDNGPLKFDVAELPTHPSRADDQQVRLTPRFRCIDLPEGAYLVATEVHAADMMPDQLTDFVLRVGELTALLEAENPGLVRECAWEGPICQHGQFIAMSPYPTVVKALPPRDVDHICSQLMTGMGSLAQLKGSDRRRFRLAARWFSRGVAAPNPIDKLLSLWTALEVHPAAGTSNVVRSTSEYIVASLSSPAAEPGVRERLWLGWLHGIRSDIVHDGHEYVPPGFDIVFGQYLDRLHAVVVFCLLAQAGVPDESILAPYLTAPHNQQRPRLWYEGTGTQT